MFFFTADQHFNDPDCLQFRGRNFASVDQMNEALITAWNEVVSDDDTVFILGDFAYQSSSINQFLSRLKGFKHLIIGNHDTMKEVYSSKHLTGVHRYLELVVSQQQLIVMSHYPFLCWRGYGWGSWHLHGHTHGRVKCNRGFPRADVGVDSEYFNEASNLQPISLDTIRASFMSPASKRVIKTQLSKKARGDRIGFNNI